MSKVASPPASPAEADRPGEDFAKPQILAPLRVKALTFEGSCDMLRLVVGVMKSRGGGMSIPLPITQKMQ